MFEIPLNLRYDLFSNQKRKFFVSSGLSTYLMTNEYYDYHYKDNNGAYTVKSYDYTANSNYWFSILNISAGFERSIGTRFAVQAEPYLKIPLKGLGFGNINLNSYGIYFGIKYKPFAKK